MIGFTPQQVDVMSVWQYMAAVEGYARANDPEAAKRLSGQERDELWEWVKG